MGSRLLEREAGIPTWEVPQVPPPSSENIPDGRRQPSEGEGTERPKGAGCGGPPGCL